MNATHRQNDTAAMPHRGLRNPAELEAFIDGVMIGTMRDKHVAGAVVAVVKDGALYFAKGYGYADAARLEPVDPSRTLFRVGSVTKLFTWTAVMQLVEEGKIDLDADVNRYIDFKIPATYSHPITMRHLMTHTAGFEDDGRDLWADDSAHTVPLGRWLSSHIPGRVRPPGTYSSYSNYGAALAGYVVERVSGVPWADYVQRQILDPLAMSEASVYQPLPPRLRGDMSVGYHFSDGGFEAKPFEFIQGATPAGTMSASATDMATFMLAHLGNGSINGHRILAESTAVLMHARTFGHDPRLPGFALGFYEQSSHGLRIIGHGGDTDWFHTDLALIPSEQLGVFVSYNTDTGGELSFRPFLVNFLDHYYPVGPPTPMMGPDAMGDAKRVAGAYWLNRMSFTTYQRLAGLAGHAVIAPDSDGSLRVTSPLGDMHLVRIGPLLYQEALGSELLAFGADSSGHVTHGFIGEAPMMAFERLPWTASPLLTAIILALAVLVFAGTLWAATTRFIRQTLGTGTRGGPASGSVARHADRAGESRLHRSRGTHGVGHRRLLQPPANGVLRRARAPGDQWAAARANRDHGRQSVDPARRHPWRAAPVHGGGAHSRGFSLVAQRVEAAGLAPVVTIGSAAALPWRRSAARPAVSSCTLCGEVR